jgi:hypothetical protein
MYLSRHDERDALAVWFFHRSTSAAWDEHVGDVLSVGGWSRACGKRGAVVPITSDFTRPDAVRRAELTRLTEAPGYASYVGFVSPNAALRRILTLRQRRERSLG